MEGIVEGLLYVQGDLGLTIKQIEDILEIDESTAKQVVLNLKNYYDENEKNGFDYAYLYDGMNKVQQSVGRVIRTATDVGAILMLDERLLTEAYTRLFPREW